MIEDASPLVMEDLYFDSQFEVADSAFKLVPLYMSMYSNYLRIQGVTNLFEYKFNIFEFMEFACSTSEGACPFHKIKLSSERGLRFQKYCEE